jgi:hypothetical protein
MLSKFTSRDYLGAAICVLLGAVVVVTGFGYGAGTLRDMGPGFVPVSAGALLMAIGIAIGVTAAPRSPEARFVDKQRGMSENRPQWRGWLCIVGGIAAFVVLGTWGGLVPASFLSVFISALGDRNNSVANAGVLAAIVTAFGVAVFHFFLYLQMPLFRWG